MASEVILPRVDMDMATGKISKWLVPSGATVTKGQPLFEIETDKATMEIEAEATGTIRDMAEAGSKDIPVGSVVAWIFGEGEVASKPAAASSPSVGQAPEAEKPPVPEPKPDTMVPEPQVAQPAAAAPKSAPAAPAQAEARPRATPLARRLARTQNIDLGTLNGSGPRGRIQAADVAAPKTVIAPVAAPQPAAEARRLEPATPAVSAPASAKAAAPAQAAGALKRLRGGTGRPLVLVHGFGGDINGWRPFLQGLTLSRPVFAVELPGHGSAPLASVASFDDLVETVGAAFADIEAADVVAHSLGAGVMTAVAARGLADLRSLLLLSPTGLGPEINGSYLQGFTAATSEASLAPWMAELVADPQLITPALVRATLKLRDADQVAAQRRLAAIVFPDGTQGFSTRADLARLRTPTRVVFGMADKIIPARHAAVLPPLVALHRLPNVGHMPHLEAIETVAAILAQTTQL